MHIRRMQIKMSVYDNSVIKCYRRSLRYNIEATQQYPDRPYMERVRIKKGSKMPALHFNLDLVMEFHGSVPAAHRQAGRKATTGSKAAPLSML